jgi:hypothetical protein
MRKAEHANNTLMVFRNKKRQAVLDIADSNGVVIKRRRISLAVYNMLRLHGIDAWYDPEATLDEEIG